MAQDISAKVAWALSKAIKGATDSQSTGSALRDATVVRKDPDGTVWVRMSGSDIDTPVNGSVAASISPGDVVQCRIDGTSLSLTGNATDPAVGESKVARIVAPMVEGIGSRLDDAIGDARSVADAAKKVAGATMQHFFSDDSGIHVTQETQEEWEVDHTGPNVLINSLGQLFRDGLNNLLTMTTENGARALSIWDGAGNAASNILAIFGEKVTIGRSTESHMEIDYHSMSMTDSGGTEYLRVSDLRDRTGYATVKHPFYGDGTTRDFRVSMPATSTESVTVDGVAASYTYSNQTYRLTPAPADGALVLITYKTNVIWAKAFTFGIRNSDTDPATGESYSAIGPYSAAFGSECIADGYCSFAAGRDSYAHGQSSVALGEAARAYDGSFAAVGGKADHGSVAFSGEATGGTSFAACSAFNEAKGLASSVFGHGTIASGDYQTAMGRYNEEDANGDFAFIVGNGTDENNRSNAFAVGWDGILHAGASDTHVATTSSVRSVTHDEVHSNGACCTVTFNVRNNAAIANGSNVNLGTVPDGYRPPQTVYAACSASNANGMGCYMAVTTDGAITVYNRSGSSVAANTVLAATLTYAL